MVLRDGNVILEVFSRGEMVLIANHYLRFFLDVVRLELGLVVGAFIL